MEKLKLHLIQLNKSLKTLGRSFFVTQELEKTGNQEFILAAEDSTIQRFEYSYQDFDIKLKDLI